MNEPESYVNIREVLGKFIGRKLLDITQHDEDEWAEDGRAYVMLMFEGGECITFYVGDEGFSYTEEDDGK